MKYLLALFLVVGLFSGCNKKNEETKWGVFNEPVEIQPLPTTAGVQEIKVSWDRDIGDAGEQGYAILRPAVVYDAVFVSNRRGRVQRIGLESGQQEWLSELDSNTFSGVGAGEGLAVVALDNGAVIALDAASGEQRWVTKLNRQISAVPTVGAGRVIVRTADGALMGLDTVSGEVIWKVQRTVPGFSVHGDSSPLISGDAVVTGLPNGKLMANSVVNGRDFWETDLSFGGGTNELERLSDIDSQPVVLGSTLFAATYQGDVVSLDLPSSSIAWRQEISTRLPLAIGGDQLYMTDTDGGIFALRSDSGEKLWHQSGLQGRGISNPVALGNRIVIGDADGNLHLLDSGDGALLQTIEVAKGAIVSLVASSNGLIALSSKGDVVSIVIDQG